MKIIIVLTPAPAANYRITNHPSFQDLTILVEPVPNPS
jgi:hypothetical protein